MCGTTANSARGTARWTAVEIFAAESAVTEKSDVWAFGMVIYVSHCACLNLHLLPTYLQFASHLQELLTRKLPYHHLKSDAQVISAILMGRLPEPPPLQTNSPDQMLWNVCEKCWTKESEMRPTIHTVYELISEHEDMRTRQQFSHSVLSYFQKNCSQLPSTRLASVSLRYHGLQRGLKRKNDSDPSTRHTPKTGILSKQAASSTSQPNSLLTVSSPTHVYINSSNDPHFKGYSRSRSNDVTASTRTPANEPAVLIIIRDYDDSTPLKPSSSVSQDNHETILVTPSPSSSANGSTQPQRRSKSINLPEDPPKKKGLFGLFRSKSSQVRERQETADEASWTLSNVWNRPAKRNGNAEFSHATEPLRYEGSIPTPSVSRRWSSLSSASVEALDGTIVCIFVRSQAHLVVDDVHHHHLFEGYSCLVTFNALASGRS